MSLDQGLWSDYSVIVYSVVAVLISMAAILALQKYSEHRLSSRQALLLPFVAGGGEVLVLEVARQEAWFWLFVGTAVTIGASIALGTAVSDREREHSVVSLAFMLGGLLLAYLLSTVPLLWTVALASVVSVFGFVIGYELSSISRIPPERSASAE